MNEILKTLFKYKYKILLVISLLILQAYFNLSLPTFTSDIVNTGIQSGGIESIIPDYISIDSYNNMENKYIIDKYYVLSTYNNKSVYKLNTSKDITNEIYKLYETNTDSVIINNIKSDYESIGIDLDELQMNYIYKVGTKMIIYAILSMGVTIYGVYISSKITAYYSRDLRRNTVNKILSLETEEINNFSTSSLITRCTNDVSQVSNLITMLLRIAIYAPIMGVGAIIKVSGYPLSWTIILSVVVILLLMGLLFKIVIPRFKKFQELLDRINLVSREILTGLPVIKAFTNYKREEERFDIANKDLNDNGIFIGTVMSIMNPMLTFLMSSVSILIIWFGANEVNNYTMQVGDLIAFITYTMQIITAFLMLAITGVMLPRSIVSIKRLNEVFNTKKTILDKDKTKHISDIKEHSVTFNEVYFRYNNATEDVLRNISFSVKTGETIAIIGGTGSGKSTLVNLLPRLYDVTSGKILIDDIDIKDIKIKELRSIIGYIPQKGKLFKGSVRSNLLLGGIKRDDKELLEAIKLSEAVDFVNNNLDKEISENATNISGGQKGRLSIARALVRSPLIYIFDDAFSALDFKTDANVRKNLKKIVKNKIVFIVAQRIGTVMDADKIIVLDEGVIVGIGKHEELIKTCPIYKEICNSQLGGISNE